MPGQSTKQLIEVTDIREGVIFLKNDSMRVVLDVSSINFDLRSEEEQAAILQNFQRFLNAIDFPLQIIIQSRKFDISKYLSNIESSLDTLSNELLKIQATEYMKFITELSELANIMSKKFYIIVPFFVSEAPGASEGLVDKLTGFFKATGKSDTSKTATGKSVSEEEFSSHRNQLIQRAEILLDGLIALGLRAKLLNDEELMSMFFSLYNPGAETAVVHEERKELSES